MNGGELAIDCFCKQSNIAFKVGVVSEYLGTNEGKCCKEIADVFMSSEKAMGLLHKDKRVAFLMYVGETVARREEEIRLELYM